MGHISISQKENPEGSSSFLKVTLLGSSRARTRAEVCTSQKSAHSPSQAACPNQLNSMFPAQQERISELCSCTMYGFLWHNPSLTSHFVPWGASTRQSYSCLPCCPGGQRPCLHPLLLLLGFFLNLFEVISARKSLV